MLILWAEEDVQFTPKMETEGSLPNSCLQMFLFIVDYPKAFHKPWIQCIVMGASWHAHKAKKYLAVWSPELIVSSSRTKNSLRDDNIPKYLVLTHPISKRGGKIRVPMRAGFSWQCVTSLASDEYCLMLAPAVRSVMVKNWQERKKSPVQGAAMFH